MARDLEDRLDAALAPKPRKKRSPPGVNKEAVENFLGTCDGLSYQEAVANVELDAKSYGWNYATTGAIRTELAKRFGAGGLR